MFNINDTTIPIPETTGDILMICIAFLVGFIFGFITKAIFQKKDATSEVMLSWLITGIWLSMVVISYVTKIEIPTFFNVLGFGTSGNLVGISFGTLISAFLKLKTRGTQ